MIRSEFWNDVFTVRGSVTPLVMKRVMSFALFSALVWWSMTSYGIGSGGGVAIYEVVGAILALLLVLRTNAGYDRWYEGRKLWGGIVNQTRNIALIARAYGPEEGPWREQVIRWTAAFAHACRHSLRGERDFTDLDELLGPDEAKKLAKSQHMPMYASQQLGLLLHAAVESGKLDRFAFMQAEKERAQLIDHIGACERIMKTPLALVYSIMIRRFLFLYLIALPIGLVDKTGVFTPLITTIVTFPLLSLDQIGIELQNPFCAKRLSHLPLGEICKNIEANLMSCLTNSDQSTNFSTGENVVMNIMESDSKPSKAEVETRRRTSLPTPSLVAHRI